MLLVGWEIALWLINPKPGSPVVPFYPFWEEGSPTKIDYSKKGALIQTSLLEDVANSNGANVLAGQGCADLSCCLRVSCDRL